MVSACVHSIVVYLSMWLGTLDYAFVDYLFSLPPTAHIPETPRPYLPFVAAARQYIVTHDLESRDATRMYFSYDARDSFEVDVRLIREARLLKESTEDMRPYLFMFPNHAEVVRAKAFNVAYLNYLKKRRDIETNPDRRILLAISETEQLYEIYDALYDVTSPHYALAYKRKRLKQFVEFLGEENFKNGNLPSPVPCHRFEER